MSKTFDTCLRAVLKSGFSIFQCAKKLISGKISKPGVLTVFKRLGHGFRMEKSWFSNPNRNNYPLLSGSLDLIPGHSFRMEKTWFSNPNRNNYPLLGGSLDLIHVALNYLFLFQFVS